MGDLFNPEWVSGDMTVQSVDFIAKYIGMFAVIVISIVGFGIVMASILKNATHGLYAVSPKFWDRVDEVKKVGLRGLNSEGTNRVTNGSNNEVMKLIGTGMAVLLSCLPNIKAMTDFDDEVLDAKAYFMKAIPLMCLHIFIGVFIFYGYPSKVAQKASEFGTGVFDVVLTNVDPQAWVEDLPDKMARLKFSTDGANSERDQIVNKISKKVTTTYLGAVQDVTKEKRLETALAIEGWVDGNMSDMIDYCNFDKYKIEVTATVYKFGNNPDDSVRKVNEDSSDGVKTFAYYKPFDDFDSGTAINVSDWYIRYDVIFTTIATTGKVSSLRNTTMKTDYKIDKSGFIKVEVGDGKYYNGRGEGTIVLASGDNLDIRKIEVKSDYIEVWWKGTMPDGATVDHIEITGSRFKYRDTSSFTAEITKIFKGGSKGNVTFEAEGYNWKEGDAPDTTKGKKDSESEKK